MNSFKDHLLILDEFSMSTYEKLANHIMDKSHNASITANNYKADLKKKLANHYNMKAARLFNVANDIENHMISNKHLFKKK